MAAAHTPGPWLQYADTNIVICKWRGPGPESLRICEVSTNTRNDEGRHNLDLIAAAPDLLSIAQRWAALDAGEWHPVRWEHERVALLADTRAAIAKATGSAS